MTDFRELCRELLQIDDEQPSDYADWMRRWKAAIFRARAALAAEADGPAVPESREPASVVGEPSDVGLLELMPQQFREDLATVSRMAAHGAGTDVTPGLFRVSLNTGALDYARAVLARYGHQPAPPAEGEVAELVVWLRSERHLEPRYYARLTRAADLLEQCHPTPVPPAEGEVEELVWLLHKLANANQPRTPTGTCLLRAADLLEQCHAATIRAEN